jgi:diamine N-acetyltransferase
MDNNLKFGNISLRALEPDDIGLLYIWENNTEIWQVSNTRSPFSKHILAKYINDSEGDIYEIKQLRLIIQNETNVPVGSIDLFDIDPYHQRAGIGILIHKTEERRKGYALDALHAMENYCMNYIGLRQLYANIQVSNEASLKLFEKAGFKVSGVKKDWLRTPTGWEDELFLQKNLVQ